MVNFFNIILVGSVDVDGFVIDKRMTNRFGILVQVNNLRILFDLLAARLIEIRDRLRGTRWRRKQGLIKPIKFILATAGHNRCNEIKRHAENKTTFHKYGTSSNCLAIIVEGY